MALKSQTKNEEEVLQERLRYGRQKNLAWGILKHVGYR